MTRYQVDSEAVFTASGAVRGTIARIQSEVQAMHGQLSSLQGSWSGDAALAFQTVVADWNAPQLRVEESLNSINLALGQAGQQYADIESANARLFIR